MKKRKPNWGPWAYGALFTVVLPLLLAGWAWRLDGSGLALWPLPLPAWMGALLTAVGLGLMAAAMRDLWLLGHGLPMNAFPPKKLVRQSCYAWLRHPIYVGFVCCVAGVRCWQVRAQGFGWQRPCRRWHALPWLLVTKHPTCASALARRCNARCGWVCPCQMLQERVWPQTSNTQRMAKRLHPAPARPEGWRQQQWLCCLGPACMSCWLKCRHLPTHGLCACPGSWRGTTI